jgi:uncharacterized protein (TIGR00290 family)
MVTEDAKLSRSHGLSTDLLSTQAKAMGIPLVQQRTADSTYKNKFIEALLTLRRQGITAGVFGDIDFNEHRQWIEEVCAAGGMTPVFPLWQKDQEQLLREFIGYGFETVVVATKADILGEEWLGRCIDETFLADLKELGKTKPITPCGEAGEYHTYVVNGPLFRSRVEIQKANKELKEGHWFLRISQYQLKPKRLPKEKR